MGPSAADDSAYFSLGCHKMLPMQPVFEERVSVRPASWLTNKSQFASLAFSPLDRGGMNYDVTHSLLYFWAATAIKINHRAAPQGTLRTCLGCFWGPDQDAEDLDTT